MVQVLSLLATLHAFKFYLYICMNKALIGTEDKPLPKTPSFVLAATTKHLKQTIKSSKMIRNIN